MSSVQDYSFTSFFSSSRWTSFLCVGLPMLSVGAVGMMLIWRKQRCYCGKPETDHPRNLIPEICQEFHNKGWMTGSGGAISIRHGDEIYVSPSGILKERIKPRMLFVCDIEGSHLGGPTPSKNMKKSSCAPMFMKAYQKRGAGAVFHIHSQNAVMVTLLFSGNEFRITHHQMIKAIINCKTGKNYRYDEELVIPIIENQNEELDIKDGIVAAMEDYPETCAVLVRKHGIYLWGKTWEQAKIMCEAYDYIFEVAVRMISCGLDPRKEPK